MRRVRLSTTFYEVIHKHRPICTWKTAAFQRQSAPKIVRQTRTPLLSAGRAYSAPPNPLAKFMGEEKGGKEKMKKEGKERKRENRKQEGWREFKGGKE